MNILNTFTQDKVKSIGPARVARVRSLVLSSYYVVTIANVTSFIPSNTAIIPLPFTVIFSSIYTSSLS